ncbi:SET domain-containing protein [Anaeromyces robustus]|uniref:Histone-lysine N-methyltransferase n=1 Tax=Anaeromyces robustus TaxID=1754192 RepID=A0A1Y1XH78_9FUNG|nr:SET domain-containing protein [Anaeromyces robustus]|eukprot:ORX85118.1 SET domain-containing protein [Anaeromyces robustus]
MREWKKILDNGEEGKINVYNDIDLDGPPPNFKYIKTCEYGKDVPKPEDISDFIIGCDCPGTCDNEILCSCSVRDNLDVPKSFSYNKEGEVLITRNNIIHECNSKCFCGPNCPNRVIQKGNIPKLEIFKTKNKGWGVRAKELIRKSTFVAEYTGEIIKTNRVAKRIKKDPERTHYIFDIDILGDPEYSIDAYKKGNISHFFNHSCDPNLEVYCAQCDYYEMNIFRLAFFAKRNIEYNEELTFDYIGMEKPGGFFKNGDCYSVNTQSSISSASSNLYVVCHCGSANCRGYVYKSATMK